MASKSLKPDSAVTQTPVEIWHQILELVAQPSALFDPTNPRHCYHHFREEWRREYLRVVAYRSVCRSWRDYLLWYPSKSSLNQPFYRTGDDMKRDRVPHPDVIWLKYFIPDTPMSNLPSAVAPEAVLVSIARQAASVNAPLSIERPYRQVPQIFLDDLSRIDSLKSLSADDSDNLIELYIYNIARTLHNLVSLTFKTKDSNAFIASGGLSFPNLQILNLKVTCRDWNATTIPTWSTPVLRHVFFGDLRHRLAWPNFILFLETCVGSRLETLGIDLQGGVLKRYLPSTMWKQFPNLKSLILDLTLCTVPVPNTSEGLDGALGDEYEGIMFERLIHTGSVDKMGHLTQMLRWVWEETEQSSDLDWRRRKWVEFKACNWLNMATTTFTRRFGQRSSMEDAQRKALDLARKWKDSGRLLLDQKGEEIGDVFGLSPLRPLV